MFIESTLSLLVNASGLAAGTTRDSPEARVARYRSLVEGNAATILNKTRLPRRGKGRITMKGAAIRRYINLTVG